MCTEGALDRPLDAIVIGFYDVGLTRLGSPDPAGGQVEHPLMRALRMRRTIPITADHRGPRADPYEALSFFRQHGGADGRPPLGYQHWMENPSLGCTLLLGLIREAGFTCAFVGLVNAERDRLVDLLTREDPRTVVLVTTFYVDAEALLKTVALIRRHNTRVRIVMGGPFVYDLAHDLDDEALDEALALLGGDVFIDSAEGETTLLQLLARLREDRDLADVPNLIVRDGDRVLRTASRIEDNDVGRLLDYDQLSVEETGRAVFLRTARSCAYRCGFCNYPIRAGALRVAPVEAVEHQLRQLRRRGTELLVFVDDTFNIPVRRFRALLEMMVRNDFGFRWYAHLRCGSVRSPDVFRLMREAGCEGVFLGIESGDDRILANIGKRVTVDRYAFALEHLNENGIFSFASVFCGYPGEDDESVSRTIDFLNRTQPTAWGDQSFYLHHSAPVYDERERFGLSGGGFTWRHGTMSHRDVVERAHRRLWTGVEGPVYLGADHFSFFALAPLGAKGMDLATFCELGRRFHAVQRASYQPPADRTPEQVQADHRQALARYVDFCQTLSLAPSRFDVEAVARFADDEPDVAEAAARLLQLRMSAYARSLER